MGLLEGKTALVFGLANDRSIAWGITQALMAPGARIGLSYAGEVLERRVRPLAESIGCGFVESCDVTKDDQIQAVADRAADYFGQVDILIHSIAFAGRELLTGPYYNTDRAGFLNTMDISVYSFTGLARAFQSILRPGGSLLTMTYYGAEKVSPHYNVMGVAKAAPPGHHAPAALLDAWPSVLQRRGAGRRLLRPGCQATPASFREVA